MPNGVVTWFDPATGEGRIRRDGREYPVVRSNIETDARVPRARVHFDIKHRAGIDWAVNVTLRRGRRVSPHQHRYGDLAGAHHPDEKGHLALTDDRPGSDWAFEGHPRDLVKVWLHMVVRQELSSLRLLYAPEAVLYLGTESISGRSHITDRLDVGLRGQVFRVGEVHEQNGTVVAQLAIEGRPLEVKSRVSHGRIVEQRITEQTAGS